MDCGLTDKQLNDIISIISSNPKVEEIVLFGSRAKGNFSTGSDVDIAIKGSNLKLSDISKTLVKIDELYLPYKFDLIIFERIKEIALVKHIERIGKILYQRI